MGNADTADGVEDDKDDDDDEFEDDDTAGGHVEVGTEVVNNGLLPRC